jgi:AraC family transcriptional regulator, transcriptional activator of the genes for pyochelin and ferripyochelin receptors
MLQLNPSHFDELATIAEARGELLWQDTETETKDWGKIPQVGQMAAYQIDLANGFTLETREWRLEQDVQLVDDLTDDRLHAGLVFNLSGQVQTHLPGLGGDIEEKVGDYHFENISGLLETEIWLAQSPFRRLYLSIDPHQLMQALGGSHLEQLPSEIQASLAGQHQPYYQARQITPEIDQVITQIWHCPHTGFLRQAYLQGKAWELLTLAFAPLLPTTPAPLAVLNPDTHERVYQARTILQTQLQQPPGLGDLARQVGLNEFYLQEGFKQIFGTTVFRYLLDYRLELAKLYLQNSDGRIEDIAKTVGITNRSYFAAAFRKKFGVNPKTYRHLKKSV